MDAWKSVGRVLIVLPHTPPSQSHSMPRELVTPHTTSLLVYCYLHHIFPSVAVFYFHLKVLLNKVFIASVENVSIICHQ